MEFLIYIYLGVLLGDQLSYFTTSFVRPKGLLNLIPFRVGGWRSNINPNRVYTIKWVWQEIEFEKFKEE